MSMMKSRSSPARRGRESRLNFLRSSGESICSKSVSKGQKAKVPILINFFLLSLAQECFFYKINVVGKPFDDRYFLKKALAQPGIPHDLGGLPVGAVEAVR